MLSLLVALGVAAAGHSPATHSNPSPSATHATVSVEFCQKSFDNVLANGTGVFAQLIEDLDLAKIEGQQRVIQIQICSVYYRGMMDYVAATGPKS